MTSEEIKRLDKYFKKTFGIENLCVRARPKKEDSAELYKGEEFLGLIYKDEEDEELSYNFSMAILEIDLEDA